MADQDMADGLGENEVDVQGQFEHDVLDLDMSGSSMQFLRVNGPDINLNEVFQGIDSDGNSSSLSDATSFDEERLRFIVARRHCGTMTLFHGKVLPSLASSMISPSDTIRIKPIPIDADALKDQVSLQPTATTGLELVLWKPMLSSCTPLALDNDHCSKSKGPAAANPIWNNLNLHH
jgi:hypothetical protein